MSAEIEVIIDGESIYEVDVDTVEEIFEITTSNIENIYEVVVIEPNFFSSAMINDNSPSLLKSYSSSKIETIVIYLNGLIDQKQDILEFKTINGESILGSGNIVIDSGSSMNYGFLNTQINQLGGSF